MTTPLSRRDELLDQFGTFYAAHPEVWRLFSDISLRHSATRPRYSGKAIMEQIRWELDLHGTEATFKINDKFTAFYVRLFMIAYPRLPEFFNIRRQRSATARPTGKTESYPDRQMTLDDLFSDPTEADLTSRLTQLLKPPREGDPLGT